MKNEKKTNSNKKKDDYLPGYKHYPSNEDIYSRSKEEKDLDPEDPTKLKPENIDPDAKNEKDFKQSVSGDDLDIPGNEEDEEAMGDGNEDEENNFYSLGGDNHENLEEDQGK